MERLHAGGVKGKSTQGSGLKGGGIDGKDNDDVAVGYDDDDTGKPATNATTCGELKKEMECGLYDYCEWRNSACLPDSIGLNTTNSTSANTTTTTSSSPTEDNGDDSTTVTCGDLTTQDGCSKESSCTWATGSSTCLPAI